MYENIVTFFFSRPGLLSTLGKGLVKAAAFLGLLGVIGHTVKQLLSAATFASHTPPLIRLADTYGMAVTWFIPEGLFGMAAVLLLAITGLAAIKMGTELDRMWR